MSDAAPPHDLSVWLSSHEPGPSAFRPGRDLPSEIPSELDWRTPIEDLLAEVDLCIGAMSTATLQAAAVGVPVYLEVAGVDRAWPLNESAIPTARNAHELAEAVSAAIARPEVSGRAEMLEALGARSGATAAVCELIDELVS